LEDYYSTTSALSLYSFFGEGIAQVEIALGGQVIQMHILSLRARAGSGGENLALT